MSRTSEAIRLMMGFADRTGLTGDGPQRRYLWTDAFAVCNFLALARATGEQRYEELALRLVDRVHHTLGKHRADDSRAGWLSGLDERAGEAHPTRGGLRIGKKLPERRPGEPFDDELEWERDGQYFHYLTKWMHALDQVARSTRQPFFNLWARELARAAYHAFSHVGRAGGPPRLAWKMSIDLSRPLVSSMGQHDALDGFITCAQLQAGGPDGPDLRDELAGLASMTGAADWATGDLLGIGGLLMDACRVGQLQGGAGPLGDDLIRALLVAALEGLRRHARLGELQQPASRRLAFRELGLAIGLSALELLDGIPSARPTIEELRSYAPLGRAIESFWLHPANREVLAAPAHRDINEVMLATRLVPEGFLIL